MQKITNNLVQSFLLHLNVIENYLHVEALFKFTIVN